MSEETILPSDQEKSSIRLPPPAKYTKLSEGSKEDFVNAQTYFALEASPKAQAKRSFCVEKNNSEIHISIFCYGRTIANKNFLYLKVILSNLAFLSFNKLIFWVLNLAKIFWNSIKVDWPS
jgi:hypothetical protein